MLILLRTAFQNLFRNIRRTLALIMTIALGTAALMCIDGFNEGILNRYRDNTIHAHYGHGQINIKGYRGQAFEKPWEHWIENWDELNLFLQGLPGVEKVFPRVSFFALLTDGRQTISGMGQGIDAANEANFFYSLKIKEGELLRDEPDGILLGKGLAHSLNVKPGDTVTVLSNTIHGSINGVDLTVTGIFDTGTEEFDNRVFRLPLNQVKNLLDTEMIESVSLGLSDFSQWDATKKQIEAAFPNLEATPFSILDAVYYQHSVDWLNKQFQVIQIIIFTIVLLGIFNSVSTSILERRQEIGNLRANGESVFDVMQLLACEGIVLGVIGSLAGIALAYLLTATLLKNGILMPPAPALTIRFQVMIELQPITAFWTFLMGTCSSLFSTIFAAVRVTKTPIGQALRSL